MGRNIDYGNLMHDAMRGLIRKVLQDVADNGLPGAHHFFITFDTSHPDAELADWLSDRYPGEMTVVMQHWYDKLEVTDDGFSITLNFGDAPEPLYIPYDAIKTFVDPSVEFGLRFESQDTTDSDDLVVKTPEQDKHEVVPAPVAHTDHTDAKKTPGKKDADVVSLDSFRKH
ncbi:ClpXP protease specificity-enhancing factor SspB [uncultured Pseudosulfitobacter sp.]|uniref:SspB family protein n=1 Tax=uncultured Pseudosulfitobacter sp. TaxID=2854214 RepID=UPI0030DAE0FA|tara:strand:+ start:1767 stop:2279 length:513 start_codon:yes stop_codon:yes gene_type:complete